MSQHSVHCSHDFYIGKLDWTLLPTSSQKPFKLFSCLKTFVKSYRSMENTCLGTLNLGTQNN